MNRTYPQSLPTVTFVFPSLNNKALIPKVIASIRRQRYPKHKVELIVVDNGSEDGTPQLIRRRFPWVKLICLKRNTGSAYPITLAAKKAKGKYLLATNDDVIFDRNCLAELVKLALSDRSIGIVTGKMLYLKRPHRLAIPGFRINPYFGYQPYDRSRSNEIRECDWAPGACMFISRRLFLAVGGMDRQYIFCGDDYDLCYRIRSCGYRIMYHPRAVFYHGFTRAGGQGRPSAENLFAHYRGKFRYALKNSTPLQIATTLLTQIIIGPLYTYLLFRNHTFWPMLKALIWNLDNLKQTLAARGITKAYIRAHRIIN